MFVQRLLSGLILLAIIIATGVLGGNVLFGFIMLISLIGMSELYKMKNMHNKSLGIVAYIGAIVYFACLFILGTEYLLLGIMFATIAILACYVFRFPKYDSSQMMLAVFGVIYVAVMLSFVYQVRMFEVGQYAIWLIYISSWGSDTCAYCVGVLFGKHKMAPVLSPKKSIEGAIGGAVGSALLGFGYAVAINHFFAQEADTLVYALACLVGALCSMIGDLAASGIKRDNDVKDYGTLIPGHGGILDRFDSVIFTAPIIYYLLQL